MAVTTYCQSCCRVIRVSDSEVGRRVTCRCGESFRVEKPYPQRLEEERQRQHYLKGLAFLSRYRKRGVGRPVIRREVFSTTIVFSVLGLTAMLWLEQALFRPPPPPPMPPVRVRLMLADVDREVDETGASPLDPARLPQPPGPGEKPADEPGLDTHPVPQDVAVAATPERPAEQEGATERGRWRLVPEESKKLWDLEGLSEDPVEGKEEPTDEIGIGPPVEGAPTRPGDKSEPERPEAKGRPGSNPELEALERIARESTGGGVRFFGSPLPVKGDGIIFVMDRSASMLLGVIPPADTPRISTKWDKLELAKWELKKAIAMLPERMKFNVIFFDDCLKHWHYQPQPANPGNKKEAYLWIGKVEARGQSNVSSAVADALGEKGKNTIILLTDGTPNVIDCKSQAEATAEIHRMKIRQSNSEDEPIWCFGLSEDNASEEFLLNVAEDSGGQYTPISAKPF